MKWYHVALIVGLLVPASTAQDPPPNPEVDPNGALLQFEITGQPLVLVDIAEPTIGSVTFRDLSLDGLSIFGGPESPENPVTRHRHSVSIQPVEQNSGWLVTQLKYTFYTQAGAEEQIDFQILATNQARVAAHEFFLNVTSTDRYGSKVVTSQIITGYTPGLEAFSAISAGSLRLGPDEIGEAKVLISNGPSLYPREFDFKVAGNSCGFEVGSNSVTLGAGSQETIGLSVLAPSEKFWYNSQSCLLQIQVFPSGTESNSKTVSLVVPINGFYINGDYVVAGLLILFALILLFLFLAYRKARIEEEILGKPQAPWTIPAEKVYLTHLKTKDKRSWYIVRHYLMEEEYQSSLLWYKAYKKATKGERKRERVIVAHEHVYDRFERKWAKRIARPEKRADRKKTRLEKKYARLHRKEYKKALRAYKKDVRVVEKAHDKKVKKALKKWSKLAKVAAKKGADAPPQPHFDAPIHADPPVKPEGDFEGHKFAIKEARFRAKQMKKKLALQTKHAKEEAKVKGKVRRKVEKLAKKLDDPSFVDSLDALQ